MNRFQATITQIESEGSLHIVTFDFHGTLLRMMSLELGAEVRVGVEVILTIKSTYIALAKQLEGEVSYTNLIPATIREIKQGRHGVEEHGIVSNIQACPSSTECRKEIHFMSLVR
jgi:hypothetical protein